MRASSTSESVPFFTAIGLYRVSMGTRVSRNEDVPVDEVQVKIVEAEPLQRVIEGGFNIFRCMERTGELTRGKGCWTTYHARCK